MKCFNEDCAGNTLKSGCVIMPPENCPNFISESEFGASAPVESQSAGSVSFTDVEEWIKELEALDVDGESFADGFRAGTEMCVEIIKERLGQKKQNDLHQSERGTKR